MHRRFVLVVLASLPVHRRCLALDGPTNFNAAELRKVVAAAGPNSP